jgi:hypothetical protein
VAARFRASHHLFRLHLAALCGKSQRQAGHPRVLLESAKQNSQRSLQFLVPCAASKRAASGFLESCFSSISLIRGFAVLSAPRLALWHAVLVLEWLEWLPCPNTGRVVPLRVFHVELRIGYIGRMYEKNNGGSTAVPIAESAMA